MGDRVVSVQRLASGYWRVQFNAFHAFAQWPRGRNCGPEDVSIGEQSDPVRLQLMAYLANRAVPRG